MMECGRLTALSQSCQGVEVRILIACERTQRVCIEFRRLGHEAYSCDIQSQSGGYPDWHIQDDVLRVLDNGWDMVIAFPPCTDLSCACANLWPLKQSDGRQADAFDFILKIWNSCEIVCVENPQGWLNTNWRKPDQTVHPYFFGDPWMKRTCLWLKNLPKLPYVLKDTPLLNMMGVYKTAVDPVGYWVSSSNRKEGLLKNGKNRNADARAETFPAIARAMAGHWG